MFLLALALFILSSILCGASNQIVELWVSLRNSHLRFLYAEPTQNSIIFRALQGMGASGIYSLTMVIATNLVPRANYAKYMAIMSTVFAVASVVGPILGGAISTHSTWRWVFLLKCAKLPHAVSLSYRNSNMLTWSTVLQLAPYRLSLWPSTYLHLSHRKM